MELILTLVLDEKIDATDGRELSSSRAQRRVSDYFYLMVELDFSDRQSEVTVQVDDPALLQIRGKHEYCIVLGEVSPVQRSLLAKSVEATMLRG